MRKNKGFILPVALVFLSAISILGIFVVYRFTNTGQDEYQMSNAQNDQYNKARAGIERVRYHLIRPKPSEQSEKHFWGDIPISTFSFTIDGEEVKVTVEDINLIEE